MCSVTNQIPIRISKNFSTWEEERHYGGILCGCYILCPYFDEGNQSPNSKLRSPCNSYQKLELVFWKSCKCFACIDHRTTVWGDCFCHMVLLLRDRSVCLPRRVVQDANGSRFHWGAKSSTYLATRPILLFLFLMNLHVACCNISFLLTN